MCVEFRFVFDQRSGCDTIAGTDSRRSAGPAFVLMNCAHCHGDDARGDEGPDLHNLHRSDARIHEVITAGIKGEMPSFGKKLGDQTFDN
jgi:Cytochrome c, mono- and diheme variants